MFRSLCYRARLTRRKERKWQHESTANFVQFGAFDSLFVVVELVAFSAVLRKPCEEHTIQAISAQVVLLVLTRSVTSTTRLKSQPRLCGVRIPTCNMHLYSLNLQGETDGCCLAILGSMMRLRFLLSGSVCSRLFLSVTDLCD